MTTAQELAALDAAATQGEWLMRKIGHDHLQVHNALEHEVLSSPRAANACFIVALVNAYRSDQLVFAPSVEDLIGVISDGHILVSDGYYRALATAILTSMGAKTVS